jgi:hypothetical protein
MAMHDVPLAPLMFSAVANDSWHELIISRSVLRQDPRPGDHLTFRELDEFRYTITPPVTVKVLQVIDRHGNRSIPLDCFLLRFELVKDAENPPVIEPRYKPKDRRLEARPEPARPSRYWPRP